MVNVIYDTKTILGVTCTVVLDTVWVGGVQDGYLAEGTYDWYAQDKDGNVWYFGEDTKEYDEDGNVISTEGSWEAGPGADDAKPGIVMDGDPQPGDSYRQEYLEGEGYGQGPHIERVRLGSPRRLRGMPDDEKMDSA